MVKYYSSTAENHLEVVSASHSNFLQNGDVVSQKSKSIKKEKNQLYVQPCGAETEIGCEDTLST